MENASLVSRKKHGGVFIRYTTMFPGAANVMLYGRIRHGPVQPPIGSWMADYGTGREPRH